MYEANRAVVAIFDDAPHAHLNFESLIEFDKSIAFNAAVAVKVDGGRLEIQRDHRAHGSAGKEIQGAGKTLSSRLLASLDAEGETSGASPKGFRILHDKYESFLQIANAALDDGEALVAIVCFAPDAERFDQLLVEARQVVQLDIESDD